MAAGILVVMIFSLSCPAVSGHMPPERSLKPPGWEAGQLSDRVGDYASRDVPRLRDDCDVLAAGRRAVPLEVVAFALLPGTAVGRSARSTSLYFIAFATSLV
jgi:hypothetical protein